MKKTLLKTMSLAAIAVALAATSVKAQTPFSGTYTQGDFLLGFRVTGGTGAGTDVLVDLGTINPASPTTFSTPNLDSLLVSTFGANWYSRSDLLFGAAAGGAGNANLYGSSGEVTGGSESMVWANPSTTQANTLRGKINAEGAAYGSGSPTQANPAVAQTISSTPNNYASYQPGGSPTVNNQGISYAYFNPSIEASNPSGSLLDIIQISPPGSGGTVGAPGIDLGDLNIDSLGDVTFTPDISEVPEPSTYAAASSAVLGLVLIQLRRRTAKA